MKFGSLNVAKWRWHDKNGIEKSVYLLEFSTVQANKESRMNELLSAGLWTRLRELANQAQRKYASIAYVTDDRFVKFGKGDVLVTDASDRAVMSGQTSAEVLKAAVKRKAEVVSIPGLHTKLYVFDNQVIIGSANLSKGSEKLTEVALFTDQPSTLSASRCLIENLRASGDPVDDAFISRIINLPVEKLPLSIPFNKSIKNVDVASRTWLVGLHEIEPSAVEHPLIKEEELVAKSYASDEDSEVSWIRMRGKSLFRREAQKGDVIICIWSASPKSKPYGVYHHAPILLREDDPDTNSTRFWIEDFPNSKETTLTWTRFKKLYARVGLPGKFTQWPAREIASNHSAALHNLWFDRE